MLMACVRLLFGNSADAYLKVHHKGPSQADVTEGSSGIWERLHYDWSDSDRVVLTTTESNVWGGGLLGFEVAQVRKRSVRRPSRFLPYEFPRGSLMMNSVNSPGSVSTSILPPCCLTTITWAIESPSPVPSPAGLVVKKGLNIFSRTSVGMPVPLSRMRISTALPRSLVVAPTRGSKLSSSASTLRRVAA